MSNVVQFYTKVIFLVNIKYNFQDVMYSIDPSFQRFHRKKKLGSHYSV